MSEFEKGRPGTAIGRGPFANLLEATGYLDRGEPAPGVTISPEANGQRRGAFRPDAVWRGESSLTVYFKYSQQSPPPDDIATWRREIWNEGFCPLLWVVTAGTIDLYNGFGRPQAEGDSEAHRLRTFRMIADELEHLDALAGRLAMETGQFWSSGLVSRDTGVDQQLLQDLSVLEHQLTSSDSDRPAAQALIGRAIFTEYLVDRGIVDSALLEQLCGTRSLPDALRDPERAQILFAWLSKTFNGDMFPAEPALIVDPRHLDRIASFLGGESLTTGQLSLFPYQFDIIPVELISSIYERFVHGTPTEETQDRGVHYTPLSVVSLILDETLRGVTGHESVLDLTCGSGLFLVEALRRLVRAGSPDGRPTRRLIRSVLYEQLFGVDISEAAIRVAAFSLYLAALELDPDPQPPEALTFEPLIGRSLLIGDCWEFTRSPETFAGTPRTELAATSYDVIVGNPPWSFRGRAGTAERRARRAGPGVLSPRGEALDFVLHAIEFGHDRTRYGFVVSAVSLFSASGTGRRVVNTVLRRLSPVTVVNLSSLSSWLFPAAKMPAAVLLATATRDGHDDLTLINVPWSEYSERSRTFVISPSDVVQVPVNVVLDQPTGLKTAVFGRGRDALLLDHLRSRYLDLGQWLQTVGDGWHAGLTVGDIAQRTRDARPLIGLPFLGKSQLERLHVLGTLEGFDHPYAQWPRSRETYEAPLLLMKQGLTGPRPTAAVVERDLVFSDAFFGARIPRSRVDEARLAATILSSALATWFLLLTAGEFGVFKRRLFVRDVGGLPIPDLTEVVHMPAGQALLALEAEARGSGGELDTAVLDRAVFDAYGLDQRDRLLVLDGLERGSWQWAPSRQQSAKHATTEDVTAYAHVLLEALDSWLRPLGRHSVQADVYALPLDAPLRVVRCFLVAGEHASTARVNRVVPSSSLRRLLDDVGKRLRVHISEALVGQRELRVHGPDEVVLIKPAACYSWTAGKALEDADAVILDTMQRGLA